jgi:predicted DCC family thiol-disulfide oxidoreductase YuxK
VSDFAPAQRKDYDGGATRHYRLTATKVHQPACECAVVLFDGVCNLCNGSVSFIVARDPAAHFHFAALQSEAAQRLLRESGVHENLPDSVALVEHSRVYTRSTAALRIARQLRFPWPVFYALIVLPRWLRDAGYDLIARHRYRWFGRRDACMMPTPELRRRFLA